MRQSRERIVIGQELAPIFGRFAGSDIAKVPDPTPILGCRVEQRRRVSIQGLSISEPDLICALLIRMEI